MSHCLLFWCNCPLCRHSTDPLPAHMAQFVRVNACLLEFPFATFTGPRIFPSKDGSHTRALQV